MVELQKYLYAVGAGSLSAIFTLLVIEAFVHLRFPQEAQPGYVGDAMWHLPKFGDNGWFLHASDGRVRACNMDKVSVVGDKPGPRCSNWR